MRSSGRKWVSFVLAAMLVLGMFAQGVPANAWQVAAPAESGENGAEPETGEPWDGGMTTLEKGDYFAITTVINEHIWALEPFGCGLSPYDPESIWQLWYEDENNCLRWLPDTIYPEDASTLCVHIHESAEGANYSYEYNNLCVADGIEYKVIKWDNSFEGNVPVALDEESGHFTINDYENKLSDDFPKVNDYVSVGVYAGNLEEEEERYKEGMALSLDTLAIFRTPSPENELTFRKTPLEEAPRYPRFVDNKLEQDDWKITYNTDGTYNVEVTGRLNFPIREKYDIAVASLYCGNTRYGVVEIAPGRQEFTVRAEGLPDGQEAHFLFEIQQHYIGEIPESASGWQYCWSGGIHADAKWELYEETTSIPVKKLWADGKDHSGDSVDLSLVENGEETSYKVTLNEESGWQGAFKHVPYERWTYPSVCSYPSSVADVPSSVADTPWRGYGKIPLAPREYTVVETSGTPGYAPTYGFEGPTALTPGQTHSLQAVFLSDDGNTTWAMSVDGVCEYVQREPSQQFFLNGDHALIGKTEDGFLHLLLHFEEAGAEGKYYLYFVDPYDGKLYFSADCEGQSTTEKNQATAFEFRDFETGETLAALPEDTFQPVETLLQVYEDGKGTGLVFDLYGGITAYEFENPYQKFTICCCDGQLVVFCDMLEEPTGIFLMEPCEGVVGEYLLCMPYWDDNGEWLLGYVGGWDSNAEMPKMAEQKEEALHFGLGAGIFDKVFTVTNTPLPASLEVSKTVSGGGADQNKEFAFTVTLDDTTVTGQYGDMEFENGVAAFTLKHGEKKTAVGLLDGIAYEVAETDSAGYAVTVNGSEAADGKASGTLTGGETVTLAFNNDKPEPPTEPSEPSDPSEPSKPTEPSEPSDPSSPSEPGKPSEPSDPSEPSNPSEPSSPSEPSKPTSPSKPTEPDAPKTGDETNMGLMLCVMGVSLAGIILLAFLLLKKNYSGKYLK